MSYLETLISRFSGKGIVVDTNLMLLILVGTYNKSFISKFKRTQEYNEEDFVCLLNFLKYFRIITTPNIISEVTNLTDALNNQTSYKLFEQLKLVLKSSNEYYIKTNVAMNNTSFLRFGLTDSTIYELSKKGFLILTDDFPLYGFLYSQHRYVINFNHIRSEYILGT